MYGNAQYRKAKYDFTGSQDSFEFFYPGLAMFRYLIRDQKKSFRNLVIIGSESSVWFDLVLNFKRFFALDGIAFPYADRIADPAGGESPAAVQSEEGGIIEATARCTSDDVALIQQKVNEILSQHYKCSLTLLIYADDISQLSVQTGIIGKILENRELFLDRNVYLDITNGFRFIPLIVLASLKFLQNIQNLRMADIFYGQMYSSGVSYLSLGMLSGIYDEAVSYALFSDSAGLHHIASVCTDTRICSELLEIDKRLNLQEFGRAGTEFRGILPKLKEFFRDSNVFTEEFFDDIRESLSGDMNRLLKRYADSGQLFSAVLLIEFLRLGGQNVFNGNEKLEKKFQKNFRNKVLHYEYADRESAVTADFGKRLRAFLYENGIIRSSRELMDPAEVPLPILFTFLGSAEYKNLIFDPNEFGISESRFVANSLSLEYFRKHEISKYIVIGTYTSGWKGFVDFLLEQYDESLEAIDALAEIEACFQKYTSLKTDFRGKQTEDYILNSGAVAEINRLFERHREALQQNIEIFGYEDTGSSQNSYEELRSFMADSISPGQHFSVDITHSYRSMPIVAFLTLFSVMELKGSKLDRLWYTYDRRDGSGTGKLLDLSYLADLINDSMAVGLFNESQDPGYLLPLLERHLPDQTELCECIRKGSEAEKMLYFSAAVKSYGRALEIISTLDLSSDNKLPGMIFPFFEKNLQNAKSELFSRAAGFCDRYRYSMSICALYEAYNSFAEELYGKSGFRKLDPWDPDLYRYSDLLDAMFKTEGEYRSELSETERSDGRADMHVRQHRYSAIVRAARRLISVSDSDSFDIIKKLRRYITSEIDANLKNGVLDIAALEETIKDAADELRQLNRLKNEFFEVVKIFSLYAEYISFAEELYEKSGFGQLDPEDESMSGYSELLGALLKGDDEYEKELSDLEREIPDGREECIRMHRYDSIIRSACRMISCSDTFEELKKLRRCISGNAGADVLTGNGQSIYLKNGALNMAALEGTIKDAADELRQLDRLKDEFVGLVKSKLPERNSGGEQPAEDGNSLCPAEDQRTSEEISGADPQ